MKNLNAFIILVLSFAGNLMSQNINVAHHTSIDGSGNMVSINSKSYYLEQITEGCCFILTNLVATDESGQILFKKSFFFNDFTSPVKLLQTKDHSLALIGRAVNCDVATNPFYENYFIKTDTTGVTQFQTSIQRFYPSSYGTQLDYLNDFTQHADSSYYLVSDSLLYQYSKTGQFISVVNTGFTSIHSITALNSTNLLLNGTLNDTLRNVEITGADSIVNSQTANSAISKFIQTSSGSLVGKTYTGNLEKYGSNLQVINTSTNTINTAIRFRDFNIRNDSLFTTGISTPASAPFYKLLDTNFAILYQVQTNYKSIFPTGITLNNHNKVNIITTGFSANSYVTFLGLYQLPITGSIISTPDIGVSSFSVNSAGFTHTFPYASYLFYDLNVTIKNHSADTIKTFYLNQYISLDYCWDLFHKFYPVTILPYDSVVVSTDTIFGTLYGNDYLQSHSKNGIIYSGACFFTTIPNAQNDPDVSNDARCDSFPVAVIIDAIPKNLLADKHLKIFPNPSDRNLNIEWEAGSGTGGYKLILTNSLGQVEKAEEGALQTGTVTLDISALKSGIYLLQVFEQGQLSHAEKIIKE